MSAGATVCAVCKRSFEAYYIPKCPPCQACQCVVCVPCHMSFTKQKLGDDFCCAGSASASRPVRKRKLNQGKWGLSPAEISFLTRHADAPSERLNGDDLLRRDAITARVTRWKERSALKNSKRKARRIELKRLKWTPWTFIGVKAHLPVPPASMSLYETAEKAVESFLSGDSDFIASFLADQPRGSERLFLAPPLIYDLGLSGAVDKDNFYRLVTLFDQEGEDRGDDGALRVGLLAALGLVPPPDGAVEAKAIESKHPGRCSMCGIFPLAAAFKSKSYGCQEHGAPHIACASCTDRFLSRIGDAPCCVVSLKPGLAPKLEPSVFLIAAKRKIQRLKKKSA